MSDTHDIRLSKLDYSPDPRGSAAEMNELVTSMRAVGQLQEVVTDSADRVIAGNRRCVAAERLGWTHVRRRIATNLDDKVKALKAERDENTCRVALTRSEMLDFASRLMALERPKAEERQKATRIGAANPGEGQCPSPEKPGKTADKVGEAVGISGRTLTRAQAVLDAGKVDATKYGDLAKRVRSEDEPVEPLYQELRRRQEVYAAADERPAAYRDLATRLTESRETDEVYADFQERQAEVKRDTAPLADADGTEVPHALRPDWTAPHRGDAVKAIDDLVALVDAVVDLLEAKAPADPWLNFAAFRRSAKAARDELGVMAGLVKASVPCRVCAKCGGERCRACKQAGWVPAS